MAGQGCKTGQHLDPIVEWIVLGQGASDENRSCSFGYIHQEHNQCRAFAHVAQHIGGAGRAGADGAQVDPLAPLTGQEAAG